MPFKKLMTTILSAMCVVSASSSYAEDLSFYSDKHNWEDGMKVIAETASKASGLNITSQMIYPPDKYQAFMQTSIAGGSAPAIFSYWNGNQLKDIVSTGVAADLSEYWDKAIKDGDFSAAQRELVSIDGKPYATLMNVAYWVVFYNVKAFEKAGIADTPKTWEELVVDCEKLKAAGYKPFNAPASFGWMPFIWFSQVVSATNPDAFVGLTDGTVPYNGPEVRKAFEVWAEFYNKGYFTDPREQDESKHFADGSAAMYVVGDWAVGDLAGRGMKAGVDYKSFLMPSYSPDIPQSVIVEAAPILFSKQALADHPSLGKAIDALMGGDFSNALSESVGVYNGNLKASTPNAIVEADRDLVVEAKPRILVRWWEAVPSQIQGDLVSKMGEFMFDPTMENAEKVMNDMQAINADYWASK